MRVVGYIGVSLGGVIAGVVVGLLMAPWEGKRTRNKISDTVDDPCKKYGIKLSEKDADSLVDDTREATSDIVE